MSITEYIDLDSIYCELSKQHLEKEINEITRLINFDEKSITLEKEIKYYTNGNIASIYYKTDGKMHGKELLYDIDGNKLYEYEWKCGKKHGLHTIYINSYDQIIKSIYINNKKYGKESTIRIKDNVVISECEWFNDKKHGNSFTLYDNDKVCLEQKWQGGNCIDSKWSYENNPVKKR